MNLTLFWKNKVREPKIMYFHIIEHELVGCAGFSVTSEVTTTVGLATILMTVWFIFFMFIGKC